MERPRELAQPDVHASQIEQVLEALERIDLDVLQVEAIETDFFLKATVEVLDDLLAHLAVVAAREEPHLLQSLDELVGVAADDSFQKFGDALAHARRELGHGAEIQEDERPIGAGEHVPRVRIGVVDAVHEDHLAIGANDLPRELFSVDAGLIDRRGVAHLHAVDEVGRQNVSRRQLGDDAREDDHRIGGEVLREALDVLRLTREIELLGDHLADLVVVGVEALHRHENLHDAHDAADRLEIEPRDRVDVTMLHLDGDARAIFQIGLVHLPERRARDGPAFEAAEELIDRASEIGEDALLDVRERARRHLVLEALEARSKLLGEEVGHDAEELADFDEETLKLDDRALDAHRVLAMGGPNPVVVPTRAEKPASEAEPEVGEDHLKCGEVRPDEAIALNARAMDGELTIGPDAHALCIGHHEKKGYQSSDPVPFSAHSAMRS